MTDKFVPFDAAERKAISEDLASTLFVEAGAGTGKTTSLVARVVNLVATGEAKVDRVAVITFTEAAAAELRDRVRSELENASIDGDRCEEQRERCQQGLHDIDQATITTIHAFASLLLHERPLEAGLPPAFQVSDETQAGIRFNEEWNAWLNAGLEDGDLGVHFSRALTLGLELDKLKAAARKFHENHDLLALAGDFNTSDSFAPQVAAKLLDAVPELERLCAFSNIGDGDPLHDHTRSKVAAIKRLQGVDPSSGLSYLMLYRLGQLEIKKGAQKNWAADPKSGENACKLLKDRFADLGEELNRELVRAKRAALMHLLKSLRSLALGYAQRRRREGRAEFHDLLIWARDLLRDNLDVRDHFRNSYSHVFIDEVQDTDPLQAEIAMFLAEAVPEGTADEDRPRKWQEVKPEPGKLFVVGDPKQSIYRFRRADLQQMNLLRDRIEGHGGRSLNLVQNFRSHKPVVDWVNHIFETYMQGDPSQPQYQRMHHRWEYPSDDMERPQVWALLKQVDGLTDEIRNAEAKSIADMINRMVAEGWKVRNPGFSEGSDTERYRPVAYSDICILMPTRTALRNLERGLENANVPYRLENASLIFETQEVRDLINCLRAIDDPSNQVAVVGALRSPAFGCSDVELFHHRESGGGFDYTRIKNFDTGPVGSALSVLQAFHEQRIREFPGALIGRFIRDRGLMEVAISHPRTREQWRRYRFVVEQAWRFTQAGDTSLRAFVDWIQDQMEERARVTETPLPDSDEESVRVMTVHAAKGLEFPVVILTGMSTKRRVVNDPVFFDRSDNRVEVGIGSQSKRIATSGYEELLESEREEDDAEYLRIMYVATTRACDHLVLSLTGVDKQPGRFAAKAMNALEGIEGLWTWIVDAGKLDPPVIEPPLQPSTVDHTIEARDAWESGRMALIEELSRPAVVSATGLGKVSAGPEDKPEQETDEPWRKGRAGTSVGRAVHAVLQTIDLSSGADLESMVEAQAAAERVPDRKAEIARLVRTALDGEIVKRAIASGRLWREVPVSAPVDGGALHGFIDLLFEEDGQMVIVDYKTDSLSADETAKAVSRYKLQGGAYAYALRKMTRKPVKDVVFFYLQPRNEESLPDLPQAISAAEETAKSAFATM